MNKLFIIIRNRRHILWLWFLNKQCYSASFACEKKKNNKLDEQMFKSECLGHEEVPVRVGRLPCQYRGS